MERTPKYRTSNTRNIECPNIELSEHHILAQNRTSNMSNITKNRTVCELRTVHSKTSTYELLKIKIFKLQTHLLWSCIFVVTSLKMTSLRVTSLLYYNVNDVSHSQTHYFQTCHTKNTGAMCIVHYCSSKNEFQSAP
mgnify:CR=1 FL=1